MNPEELVPAADHMAVVANATRVLGQVVNMNGRRLARAYAESRMRVYMADPNNLARLQPMQSRAFRRARVLELRTQAKTRTPELAKKVLREQFVFRPVRFHNIPAINHKKVIRALMTKVTGKYARTVLKELLAIATAVEPEVPCTT